MTSYFQEIEMSSFLIIEEKCYFTSIFWKGHLSGNLQKISYFNIFFPERSSFIFCLKNKIIFSGNRNIIFPDNARKIISHCIVFWEDHLLRTIGKNLMQKTIFLMVIFFEGTLRVQVFTPIITPIIPVTTVIFGKCLFILSLLR